MEILSTLFYLATFLLLGFFLLSPLLLVGVVLKDVTGSRSWLVVSFGLAVPVGVGLLLSAMGVAALDILFGLLTGLLLLLVLSPFVRRRRHHHVQQPERGRQPEPEEMATGARPEPPAHTSVAPDPPEAPEGWLVHDDGSVTDELGRRWRRVHDW